DVVDEWVEGAVAMVRRTEISHRDVWRAGDLLFQHIDQSRFADARFARQHYGATVATHRLLPALPQQRALRFAPDQRSLARAQGFEPAREPALAHHAPRADRPGEAPQRQRSKLLVFEQSAAQPPRALGNHHGAGLGHGLEPERDIESLADDFLLLTDAFAADDQAGSNADASLRHVGDGGGEPADFVDQRQA